MRATLFAGTILVVVFVLFRLSVFTVDRTEFVYVTQFGRYVATFDGGLEDQAGLHFKLPWPIQSAQRLDRRLQTFDLPAMELLTHEKGGQTIDRTLTLDAYVCWRIAGSDGVDRFIKTVGTADRARTILGQRIGSELGAAIGQMELDDLLSIEDGKVERQRELLRQRLLASWKGGDSAVGDYGIEVLDIRLRRATHPPQVREAIFARIKSEREKKVADYRSEGDRKAKDIASEAESNHRNLLADAQSEVQRIRGLAETEADRIRNQAQGKDPQFYGFLKKLEEYQHILGDNKTMLLLSTHRDLFDLLFGPPKLKDMQPLPAPKEGK